jgi:hypothetical protein
VIKGNYNLCTYSERIDRRKTKKERKKERKTGSKLLTLREEKGKECRSEFVMNERLSSEYNY